MRNMKILLLQPGYYDFATGNLIKKRHKKGLCPTFVLPYLASLMPKNAEITLVDETIQDIDFTQQYDFVGISVKTPQAVRAYEIAHIFRNKNTPVVMGGYHVSLCPGEAQEQCDAIIIGEAEYVWKDFLADFAMGLIKKRYVSDTRFDMHSMPFPRYDLLDWNAYSVFYGTKVPLETSRGCVHRCSFCSTPEVYKQGVRYRPVNEVVEDIKRIKKDCNYIKKPLFVFIDDNITANPNRACELFEALIPLGIRWSGYFTSESGFNSKLVKLAARSGCFCAFVGLESINSQSLESAHKEFNTVKNFTDIVKNFRDNRIIMAVGIILGFLEDTPVTFYETTDFLIRNSVPIAVLSPLYPFPGTPIYNSFVQKGIFDNPCFWLTKHNPHSLFRHDNLLNEGYTLEGLFDDSLAKLMSVKAIFKRTWPMKEFFVPLFIHNLALRYFLRKYGVFAFV